MVANERERKSKELPEHLYELGDGEWGLWRWVALRGAGFAAREVLGLATETAAAAADRLTAAETAAAEARQVAINRLKQELQNAEGQARRRLGKVLQGVRRGRKGDAEGVKDEAARGLVKQYEQARLEVEQRQQEYAKEYQAGVAAVSRRLREVAAGERFREAVIWQNRRAFHSGIDYLLRQSPDALQNGKARRQEELVANYLQRYCTKNDTIGFFGPVGWAKITEQAETLIVRPGPNLVTQRQVYFEGWCIDALCRVISAERRLQPWIAPRRVCFIDLEGTLLHTPSRAPVRVSAAVAAVLAACDGKRSAQQIAEALTKEAGPGIGSPAEVFSVLEGLERKGLIVWTLESTQETYPERTLRRLLEQIEVAEVREAALLPLDELEAARQRIGEAAGDARRLDEAIGELEESFRRITGAEATRSAGQMYAARTLVYEDSQRDLEVKLGPRLIAELKEPLGLMLSSARWFISELEKRCQKRLTEIYARLASGVGGRGVDFMTFWYMARPIFLVRKNEEVEKVSEEFRRRWGKVLGKHLEGRRVRLKAEEIGEEVRREFATEERRYTLGRYHSPDVMIAAADEEAIERGEFELVLGELHIGANTIAVSVDANHHPQPEELYTAADLDFAEPRIIAIIPKTHRVGQTLRLLPALMRPRDIHLKVMPQPLVGGQAEAIALGELVIEERGRNLIARTRDGRLRFDLMEAFCEVLGALIGRAFDILGKSRHNPRITIDKVVICRETWRLPVSEFAFAFIKDGAERYRAARQFQQRLELPRFVFARPAVEDKPFYVDIDSPMYVDILAKAVRRQVESEYKEEAISLTEMLPSSEQAWLRDVEGNRYTSELRMVCVNLACR